MYREMNRRVVCISLLAAPLLFAQVKPQEPIQPPGTRMEYKQVDGKALSLWITEPKDVGAEDAAPLRAAVVLFHGGGWTGGTPALLAPQAKVVAQHGAVGILVQYRFIPDRKQEPRICVEDSKSAIRWVRAHAKELKIDPNRIVAAGGSAGGYDAAYATMAPGWDDPGDDLAISPAGNAMVLWNPVIDTSESGYSHETFGDDASKRSPMTYLSKSTPPMLIQAGADDVWIHKDVLHAFQAKAKSLGVRCEVIIYDGQKHGFFNREPFLSQTNDAMIRFLASLGYVRP
jgi:acetyl esterase/lipase